MWCHCDDYLLQEKQIFLRSGFGSVLMWILLNSGDCRSPVNLCHTECVSQGCLRFFSDSGR